MHDLAGVADEHAERHRVLQGRSSARFTTPQLLDHLRHGHAIRLADAIEEPERVVLADIARRRDRGHRGCGWRRRAEPKIAARPPEAGGLCGREKGAGRFGAEGF